MDDEVKYQVNDADAEGVAFNTSVPVPQRLAPVEVATVGLLTTMIFGKVLKQISPKPFLICTLY